MNRDHTVIVRGALFVWWLLLGAALTEWQHGTAGRTRRPSSAGKTSATPRDAQRNAPTNVAVILWNA